MPEQKKHLGEDILDAFIIDEINKREKEKQNIDQPWAPNPDDEPLPPQPPKEKDDKDKDRGVTIIPYFNKNK